MYICDAKYHGIRVIAEVCFRIWDILGRGEWEKFRLNDCPLSNSYKTLCKLSLPIYNLKASVEVTEKLTGCFPGQFQLQQVGMLSQE